MNPSFSISAILLATAASLALAAEPRVTIKSPANGAKWDALAQNHLVYEVVPGPKGDHVHAYVDGREVGILRKLSGSYAMESLTPGQRTICIKVVNKAHVPIGIEQCVGIKVE